MADVVVSSNSDDCIVWVTRNSMWGPYEEVYVAPVDLRETWDGTIRICFDARGKMHVRPKLVNVLLPISSFPFYLELKLSNQRLEASQRNRGVRATLLDNLEGVDWKHVSERPTLTKSLVMPSNPSVSIHVEIPPYKKGAPTPVYLVIYSGRRNEEPERAIVEIYPTYYPDYMTVPAP